MLASSTEFDWSLWPGLTQARQLIEKMFAEGDVPRSSLIFGPEGAGTLDVARQMAQFALCLDPKPTGSCGECKACRAFLNGNSVDFQTVSPSGKQYMIRNSAIVHSDRPNDGDEESPTVPILDFFRTRPLVARHKVVILEDAHRMNLTTSNALLKTLEEPMPHAKIILTTESPSQLAPTILSRCMLIRCALPAQIGEASEMERVFSEGSPGRLQSIRDNTAAFQAMWQCFEELPTAPIAAAMRLAEQFRDATEKLPSKADQGARFRQAEAFRLLASYWLARFPERPQALASVIEAHRRTTGNVNFGIESDAVFASLLLNRG